MILALPLFSKAPEISFDPGQGFPSHFLIELSPELIEKVKEAQQCVADFSFKQVGIVTNTESQAIDVSDDEFESKTTYPGGEEARSAKISSLREEWNKYPPESHSANGIYDKFVEVAMWDWKQCDKDDMDIRNEFDREDDWL